MIILIIIGAGLVAGILLWRLSDYGGATETVGVALNAVCGILATIAVIALAIIYIVNPAREEALKTRYEMLTYQWENEFYENDNDLGKRDLVEQIREWNEDLAGYRRMQYDIWVGAFVPNIYDQFEFISLESGGRK